MEEKSDAKHKDYGKVPEYIKKYELEREIKKEEIKKQEEAAKYPKGTKSGSLLLCPFPVFFTFFGLSRFSLDDYYNLVKNPHF